MSTVPFMPFINLLYNSLTTNNTHIWIEAKSSSIHIPYAEQVFLVASAVIKLGIIDFAWKCWNDTQKFAISIVLRVFIGIYRDLGQCPMTSSLRCGNPIDVQYHDSALKCLSSEISSRCCRKNTGWLFILRVASDDVFWWCWVGAVVGGLK